MKFARTPEGGRMPGPGNRIVNPATPPAESVDALFDAALDDQEVTCQTYHEADFCKPRVLAVVGRVLHEGISPGKALIVGPFPRPFSMVLENLGFSTTRWAVTPEVTPWQDTADQTHISRPGPPEGVDTQYDVVVCDDIFEHVECPVKFLKDMGANLARDGRLILLLRNAARISSRLRLLTGRNVYPALPGYSPQDSTDTPPSVRIPSYREYAPGEIDTLLRYAGLTPIACEYVLGHKAIHGNLEVVPLLSFLRAKGLQFVQRAYPPARSHFLAVARNVRRNDVPAGDAP